MPPRASPPSAGDRHREEVKQRKKPSKRKQLVQSNDGCCQPIIQSQDDGGDEVVWKVSPTAERLQSAAAGELQLRVVGKGLSVLQPCNALTNSLKKKKSPGMAGKLELWLSSSQQVHASKLTATSDKAALQDDEDKENVPQGGLANYAESKKGTTPKTRGSASKRLLSSSQKRSLSAQKKGSASFSKGATKQPGQRRKALLDLLDRVDDALVDKGPTLIQSKLSFHRKPMSALKETNFLTHESKVTSKPEKICHGTGLPPSPRLASVQTTKYETHQAASTMGAPHECDRSTDSGDENTEVITKVQILDIGSESKTLLHLSPLTRDVENPGPVESGSCIQNQGISYAARSEILDNLRGIQYLVLEVKDGEHKLSSSLSYPQKDLRLLDEWQGIERLAYLRDTWFHAGVKPGDIVNVIGDFDTQGKCVIDREHNLLIINPDILVSGSKVGSSFACSRRAVLDERIKSSETSYPALMGTMLHQLFQVALRSEHPSLSLLSNETKLIVQRQLDGLYAIGVSESEACAKLVTEIPTILGWWQQYVGTKGFAAQEIEFGKKHGSQPVTVTETIDIEEMIWSPKYGLKGVIDASLMVKLGNLNLGGQQDHIMPLEIKTGRATTGKAATEHRAQVILYTLLMSDRYLHTIGAGLLYYLHTNQTQGVEVQHAELAGLVMRRNEHASNLLNASSNHSLPPMLQAQECGTAESSGLGELFDRYTEHLTNTHIEFFQKWDRLIDLESQDTFMSHSEIWTMSSRKREEQGRCISSLVLDMSADNSEDLQNSINSFTYSFRRASSDEDQSSPAHYTQSSLASFQDRSFSCGDYVVLSTESGHPAVAGGTITNISDNVIRVRLSRRLRVPGKLWRPRMAASSKELWQKELWRIDKDDRASSLALMRFNLLQLFVKTHGDTQRRALIVDLQAPKFESGFLADSDPAASYLRSVKDLNDDQIHAIHRIIAARDYALILGMPGTGKTSTIVHAVIALLARNSSVLLTSYTNSAVDNILLKLKKLGVDFVRVGRADAIHPELQEKTLGGGVPLTSVKEIESAVEKAQVVGVTCLAITHALFGKRKFDVCIVDEAGQITLPVCLGPVRCANTFVLVGDHYQLPPLVRSTEAREEGMAISLFRRLSEAHPQSLSVLQCQYRMCSDIMALSNSLTYSNRLRCGSLLVANASLHIDNSPKDLPPWLLQVVNPMQRLLFLDTDNLSAEESRIRNQIKNSTEASLLLRIVRVLHGGGVGMGKIGVISPYNAQVDHIQRMATKAGLSDLEVHTVDKYQGREKDCVLISFVRSNGQHQISGSLLTDWRRINVAITRAKTKLLMIGSQKTLSSTPILSLLIEKVAEVGCLLSLPPNADAFG